MRNKASGDFSVSIFVSGFQMREGPRETQILIFSALNVVVNKSKHTSFKSLVAVHRYLLVKHSVTELFFEGEFVTLRHCPFVLLTREN